MNRISRWGQVRVYAGKCFRQFIDEKQWKNFISALIIIGIISLVTSEDMFLHYQDTKNGTFAVICACIWIGLFNSIQSVCRERAIVKREHRTGLHISSYIAAHVIYEFFICFVETLIVFVVLYLKNADHMPESGLVFPMIPDMFLTLFLITFSADMIALLISCVVKSETTAMTVMPFVLIIQLVMSGQIFDLSGISEKISNFTISKWGQNGICAIANTNADVNAEYEAFIEMKDIAGGCAPEAKTLLKVWGLLILFSVVYILIGIIALKQVDRDKR